jgi:hypothetical protein
MDIRITVETTIENGEKRIHQLDGISRPYRVTCPEGFGLLLEDGKRIVEQIQRAIICDQVEEITRESRVCPTCASVRAIHDYRTRVLDTLFGPLGSKLRACVAAHAMRGQQRCRTGLFLRWPPSFQTGPLRSGSGYMRNSAPGIPFAKLRGCRIAFFLVTRPITARFMAVWDGLPSGSSAPVKLQATQRMRRRKAV